MGFSLTDILRMVGGLLLFLSMASWWTTGSTTWGYDGKYIDLRFWLHVILHQNKHLTLAELARYDGSEPSLPVYVALNGTVFDVTSARHIYGPGGPYHVFSGRDCARAFVTGCYTEPTEWTHDLRGLDVDEIEDQLAGWYRFFDRKYWVAGSVSLPEPHGEVPKECVHRRYPGHMRQ